MDDPEARTASETSEGTDQPTTNTAGGGSFARIPIAALVDRSLNDGDLRTLGGICAYMRKDDHAWPSQLLLGFATGRSRCAANRSVKKLEKQGHITVNRYRARDGSLRCVYRVNFKITPLPRLPKR